MKPNVPFCEPGPSASRADGDRRPSGADDKIPFPGYRYAAAEPPAPAAARLPYPMPSSAWPENQDYPIYMKLLNATAQPRPSVCPRAHLRFPPADQIPPDCLDWTINPASAPRRQFKTTSEPLFTLGFGSTISESWMEGDNGRQYSIKNFTFSTKRTSGANETDGSGRADEYDSLLVSIPQALEGDYHYYVWPASPVLAWIIWEHRLELPGKRILEVGAGTSLPGIVAAKCGAIVTLTDDPTVQETIKHIQKCCYMNGMYPEQIRVLGLMWGFFFPEDMNIGPFDLIIGSDCFYDRKLFEDLIATITYMLELNPLAKFMTTYHDRDPDSRFDIYAIAEKWKLNCARKSLEDLGKNNELDIYELIKVQ